MKVGENILIYILLLAASAFFLVIQQLTHIEFMFHLAAIPLEILVAVFIVEMFLENREKKQKRKQLMYIKSCLFRSEMRNLFIANFNTLKSPSLTMSEIGNAQPVHCQFQYSEIPIFNDVGNQKLNLG